VLFKSPTQRKQEQRPHVIETWWRRLGAPGLVCLAVGDPPTTFFCRQENVDVEGFIRANDDEHLFFCPHTCAPLKPEADGFQDALVKNHGKLLGRIIECSIACAALWADLDAVDPGKLGALEPTIAIESSPKRYAGLWLTDGVAPEGLNKRLTYHLGADKGGWCATKLLRLPGSRNQKYQPPPRALVLWDDGPVHRIAELERALPPLPLQAAKPRAQALLPTGGREGGLSGAADAQRLLDKYGIRGWLRRQLLDGHQIGSEDRSGMHWRLACSLQERGVPPADAFVLLWRTGWNKHESEAPVWTLVEKVWSR
jgi:hypothetical protein